MIKKESFSLLVKATHKCNLNCEYCYDRQSQLEYGNQVMSDEILKKTIDLCSDYSDNITWIWHGGEPTMAGIDFYKNAQKYFYKKYKTNFRQSMQSNGIAINQEWIDFLSEYDINTGVSCDVLDNTVRKGTGENDILKKCKEMQDRNTGGGIISVINPINSKQQIDIYKEIADYGLKSSSFNHFFDSPEAMENGLYLKDMIDDYIAGYKTLFNYLITNKKAVLERTSRLFTNSIFGLPYTICTHQDCRKQWICIEPDGKLFPCDRYYPDRYSMGNIMDYESIEDIFNSSGYQLYYSEVQKKLNNNCISCPYVYYCQGGCNANSMTKYNNFSTLDKESCELFKKTFNISYYLLREANPDININNEISKLLLEVNYYMFKEITEALKEFPFPAIKLHSEKEIVNMGNKLFETTEFKIFRFFNNIAKDFKNPQKIYIDFSFNLNSINLETSKKIRLEALHNFIEKNQNEIFDILKGEK